MRFVGLSPLHVSVRWDPSDEDGELDLVLSELGSGIDTATLDDLILEIDVQVIGSRATSMFQPFAFSTSPAPSFGDTEGRHLTPTLDAPTAVLFVDGFESGNLGAWSSTAP